MNIFKFLSRSKEITDKFKHAETLAKQGNKEQSKQIINNAKRRIHRNISWFDFAWTVCLIYLSTVTVILLGYFNIKGIYRNITIWPFWLLMFCGVFMIPIFIRVAIDQYKTLKRKK
ncbi:hypothetical protein KKG46_03720 [Patescibacteria group bacterium]|nr:hypothetical protein [Patescibacteria group bacterium]